MRQVDAPRTSSIATGPRSTDEGSTAIASRSAGEYRMTFGCSLDARQDPDDVRKGPIAVED